MSNNTQHSLTCWGRNRTIFGKAGYLSFISIWTLCIKSMTTSLLVLYIVHMLFFFCTGCLMWVDNDQREKSGFTALKELLASYSVLPSVPMTWFWWKIKKWWVRTDKQAFLLLSFNVLPDGTFPFSDNHLKAITLYWFFPVKSIAVKMTYGNEICQSHVYLLHLNRTECMKAFICSTASATISALQPLPLCYSWTKKTSFKRK